MQPEAVLLQKPFDAAQATLVNGIQCGYRLERAGSYGWEGRGMRFTGSLFPFEIGPMDLTVPDTDYARQLGRVGQTILAVSPNKILGRVIILYEEREDEANPGAVDCGVAVGQAEEMLSEDLIGSLEGWGLL